MNTKVEERGNEHASPHLHIEDGVIRIAGGLTIREHFAGLAMQGLLAHYGDAEKYEYVARWAREHADALIAALDQGQGK